MGEEITIVGYRDVDFVDDKTGRPVVGRSYYFVSEADGVVGQLAAKHFVPDSSLQKMGYKPQPGDIVVPVFNRFGKVCQFEPA